MKSKAIDTTYDKLKKEYTPPFTVKDLRDSIPAHLWVRSNVKSFAYTITDLVVVIALGWIAAVYLDHPNLPLAAKFVLWPAYWLMQVSSLNSLNINFLAHRDESIYFRRLIWLKIVVLTRVKVLIVTLLSIGIILHRTLGHW
jgi:hypothetical protein